MEDLKMRTFKRDEIEQIEAIAARVAEEIVKKALEPKPAGTKDKKKADK